MNLYRDSKGSDRISINGSDFEACFTAMQQVINEVREKRQPWLVHAKVPLLGHHTSGVRKDFYRDDEELAEDHLDDPGPLLRKQLLLQGMKEDALIEIEKETLEIVIKDFEAAAASPDPNPETVSQFVFAPTPVTEEKRGTVPCQ